MSKLFYEPNIMKKYDKESELYFQKNDSIDSILIKQQNQVNKIKNRIQIKETPLTTLTLRKYEPPSNLKARELVKRFVLSIGMLSPGESRDVIVDVLHVMLSARKKKKLLTSKEVTQAVISNRKRHKLVMNGIAESNIRRQIKRLRDIFILEKIRNTYRVSENMNLEEIFHSRIKPYLLNEILIRVSDYTKCIDKI